MITRRGFLSIPHLVIVACGMSLACALPAVDFTGIFPENIKTISIVAPSSHADNDTVIAATNELVRCGYKVKVADCVWTYSSEPAVRARAIEAAWRDSETDLILCSRGGSGAWETVQQLDFNILKARDIPFVGFSNISVLMNAFLAKGVKRPITGPMCTTLINYPNTSDSITRLCATVGRENLADTQLTVLRAPEAAVSGKPVGGHWPSINSMDATWLPDTTGRIAFIEINSSYVYTAATNQFTSLKEKGYFANLSALVLCDMGISGTNDEKESLRRWITDQVTCPVFSGYPYGHVSKLYAIDFDRPLTITTEGLLQWENAGTVCTIDAAASTTTNVTDVITGTTDVRINTQGGTGVVQLNGANTYVGTTALGGGTLEASVLVPIREPSSLGYRGTFDFQAGLFRYTGSEAAVFGHPVTLGTGTCTVENESDLTLSGAWSESAGTLKKNGAGMLAFAASGNTLAAPTVHAGTLAFTDGTTTLSGNLYIGDSVGGGEAAKTRLLVAGGKTTTKSIYIGQNTLKNGAYWADFTMTGGELTLASGCSLFLGNQDVAHVNMDVSGGKLTVAKNFGVAYQTTDVAKDINITIRDGAVVSVAKDASQRIYFNAPTSDSRQSLTVKDGGTLSTSYLCRYSTAAARVSTLFDGGQIIWAYNLSSVKSLVFRGSYYALGEQVLVGTKGVSFTGGNKDWVYIYSVPLVATNTVAGQDAQGVSFAKGRHVLSTANSWEGPTTVAATAELALGKSGTLPSASAVSVDGSLVVTGGVKSVGSLLLNGTLDLVQSAPLTLTEASATGSGTVNLYTDAKRTALVTAAGTYPVLSVPLAAKAELWRFAVSAKSGNGGYFTVTDSGATATLNLVLGDFPAAQPSCGVEGTNGTSSVAFHCVGELETVGDVAYLKPGQSARLCAQDRAGGTVVGCWRDETTGDLIWGSDVSVTPTNHTVYTAVFGPAWTWDATDKTLSNGLWTFEGTASGTAISVDSVTASPANGGTLNLATPITDASGTAYTLTSFGKLSATSATVFGKSTWTHCQALTNLYLGGEMTGIGHSAFYNCSNLAGRVVMPTSLKILKTNAFRSNTAVTDLCLDGVTNIGAYAFAACSGLKTIRFSNDLRILDRYSFNGAKNITSVTPLLPDAVEEVGRAVFYQCAKLMGDLRLQNAKRICYAAFTECGFKSVFLPAVTNIGYRAFYACPATNYVFGAQKVDFDDEENKPTNSNYKGRGYQTFYLDKTTKRHFWFPGQAPNLPPYQSNDGTGTTGMFGTSKQAGKVILHGSWRTDKTGWNRILSEIGSTDVSGKTLPSLVEGDRAAKGFFRWYNGSWGWLVDTAMPDEPFTGMMILFY